MTKRKARWTNEEINYLKENYGKMKPKNLKLNRTQAAIQCKAHDLGLKGETAKPLRIKKVRRNYHPGQRVVGFREGTPKGVGLNNQKTKGIVISTYTHHALVRLDQGWKESFKYIDLQAI